MLVALLVLRYNNIKMFNGVMNGRSMTEGQPWKRILKFVLPILAGSLLQQFHFGLAKYLEAATRDVTFKGYGTVLKNE